jgi:hypothetical protein
VEYANSNQECFLNQAISERTFVLPLAESEQEYRNLELRLHRAALEACIAYVCQNLLHIRNTRSLLLIWFWIRSASDYSIAVKRSADPWRTFDSPCHQGSLHNGFVDLFQAFVREHLFIDCLTSHVSTSTCWSNSFDLFSLFSRKTDLQTLLLLSPNVAAHCVLSR